MVLLRTLRWVLTHLVRDPLTWLWVLLVAAVWPLVALLAPVGLTTAHRPPVGQLYELAFWSALLGTLAGMGVVGRGAWFLAPLPATRRLGVELVGLLGAAALFVTTTLGTAALLGASLGSDLPPRVALAALHLAAVGLLLLRAPLPAAARALALPLLVWVLPALLVGWGGPGAGLARVLAAPGHLAFPTPMDPAGTHRGEALLPILGLILAAFLLSRPDALRRPG